MSTKRAQTKKTKNFGRNIVAIKRSYIVFVLQDVLRIDSGKTRERTVDENHAEAKHGDVDDASRRGTRLCH